MENSGESGDDTGPLGTTTFLGGNAVTASYISVQSDDMEGKFNVLEYIKTFCLICNNNTFRPEECK